MSSRAHDKASKKRKDSPPIKNAKDFLKKMKHSLIDYSNLDEIGEDAPKAIDGGSPRKNNAAA